MAFPGLSKRQHSAPNGGESRDREHFHPTPMQKHLIAAVGEFVGTFFFLWFGYAGSMQYTKLATLSPSSPGGMDDTTVFFLAFVYSFSLLVNVWAFYRISGGLFNPAVRFFSLFLSRENPKKNIPKPSHRKKAGLQSRLVYTEKNGTEND